MRITARTQSDARYAPAPSSLPRRLSIASLLLAALSGSAFAAVSPGRLTLRERDVPRLVLSKMGPLPNDAVALDYGVSARTLGAHGRAAGFFTFFARGMQGDPPSPGIDTVNDIVDAYRTPQGAHWEFGLLVRQERKIHTGTHVSPGPIGLERWAAVTNWKNQSQHVVVVLFRRGDYVVSIETVFLGNRVGLKKTAALARIIDRRIQTAR